MLTSFISSAALGTARLSADDDDIIIGDSGTTLHASADGNILIGQNALISTSGAALRNVAIGTEAGENITDGDDNIFIGYQVGDGLQLILEILLLVLTL